MLKDILYEQHVFPLIPVVPHITDAIQEWVVKQAAVPVDDDGVEPQVCVIEVKPRVCLSHQSSSDLFYDHL